MPPSDLQLLRYEMAQLTNQLSAFMEEMREEQRQQRRLWEATDGRLALVERGNAPFATDEMHRAVRQGLQEVFSLKTMLALLSLPMFLAGMFQLLIRLVSP